MVGFSQTSYVIKQKPSDAAASSSIGHNPVFRKIKTEDEIIMPKEK